jgi:hypothetical protein
LTGGKDEEFSINRHTIASLFHLSIECHRRYRGPRGDHAAIGHPERRLSGSGNDQEDSYRHPEAGRERREVEMKSPAKGEANIADDGIIPWNLKLAPGEKKQVKAVFTVTYPRNMKVTGLE